MSEQSQGDNQKENPLPKDQKIKDDLIGYLKAHSDESQLTPDMKEHIRSIPKKHPLHIQPSQSARERIEEQREGNGERER
jgi:hypothetical protein